MSRNDPMAPKPGGEASLAGPVRRITLVTGDGDASAAFYARVMGMSERPVTEHPTRLALHQRLWAGTQDVAWRERLFTQTEVAQAPSNFLIKLAGRG